MKKEKIELEKNNYSKCPKCKVSLLGKMIGNIEIDYCPQCLGLWLEENELRLIKDEKDRELRWFDTNLWEEEKDFKISSGIRVCPSCRVPLYEVRYGSSDVIVDLCNLCKGIWLDKGEFERIIDWFKKESNNQILSNYTANLLKEFSEIITGPENVKEEFLDFLMVLKLLNYKILIKYPLIAKFISELPK